MTSAAPAWQFFLDWENQVWRATWELLGGDDGWGAESLGPWDVEELARAGVRYHALAAMLNEMSTQSARQVSQALGDGAVLWRARSTTADVMPTGLAVRVWRVAQVLAGAILVCGRPQAGASWLLAEEERLEGQRPVELVRTDQGAQLVLDQLRRTVMQVRGVVDWGGREPAREMTTSAIARKGVLPRRA